MSDTQAVREAAALVAMRDAAFAAGEEYGSDCATAYEWGCRPTYTREQAMYGLDDINGASALATALAASRREESEACAMMTRSMADAMANLVLAGEKSDAIRREAMVVALTRCAAAIRARGEDHV